jgi:hypothetical protein
VIEDVRFIRLTACQVCLARTSLVLIRKSVQNTWTRDGETCVHAASAAGSCHAFAGPAPFCRAVVCDALAF